MLAARATAPKQWQRWWYICVGGELLFRRPLPAGRTVAPVVAVRDAEADELRVTEEFEELAASDEYVEQATT